MKYYGSMLNATNVILLASINYDTHHFTIFKDEGVYVLHAKRISNQMINFDSESELFTCVTRRNLERNISVRIRSNSMFTGNIEDVTNRLIIELRGNDNV